MTDREQTDHFANELDALVNRFYNEYDMSYAQVVGALQMKVYLLCTQAAGEQDEA